jgi:prohibitin 2
MKAGWWNGELAMLSRMMTRFRRWADRNFIGLSAGGLFLLFIVVYFWNNILVTIPAGHGGALWLRFFGGTMLHSTWGEGTKIIFPWDKMYVYDLRIKQSTTHVTILSKDGLQIGAELTVRYRLNPMSVGFITALAGPDYVSTLLLPTVSAVTRTICSQYLPEEIYSTKRREIELRIRELAADAVHDLIVHSPDPDIFVQDFWFRSIVLPSSLQLAIEEKLNQKQQAEQYVYIIMREEREKERKLIEAQGIKGFQDTVSSGISENYLRWKGIDATLKLAESSNSKIVIIGGKEGLPIILGPLDGANAPAGRNGANPAAADLQRALRRAMPAEPATAPGQSGSDANPASSQPPRDITLPAQPLATDPHISTPSAPLELLTPRPPAVPGTHG